MATRSGEGKTEKDVRGGEMRTIGIVDSSELCGLDVVIMKPNPEYLFQLTTSITAI